MQGYDFLDWLEAASWLAHRGFEEKKRKWQQTNGLATENQVWFLRSILDQIHLTKEQERQYDYELIDLPFDRFEGLKHELMAIQYEQDVISNPKKRFLHLVCLV